LRSRNFISHNKKQIRIYKEIEKMSKENIEFLNIDLSDLAVEDVELFLEEGSRGLSDFGASCGTTTCGSGCGTNSCTTPKVLTDSTISGSTTTRPDQF
jgi:hypothetical protein